MAYNHLVHVFRPKWINEKVHVVFSASEKSNGGLAESCVSSRVRVVRVVLTFVWCHA